MRYVTIPGTEITPSVITLGTGPYGDTLSESECFRLMDAYLEHGGNFIDTANVYGDWIPGTKSSSEKMIGQWMKERAAREQVIVATKGAHPDLAAMHIPRVTPADIVHDVEQSLTHLQTDYIDLYWLHRDDPNQPVAEIIDVLNEQIRAGKIRAIGCSNWQLSRMQEANAYAQKQGLQGFVASQTMWSLAVPNIDKLGDPSLVVMSDADLAIHEQTGWASVPFTSQAGGFFSGRYAKEVVPERKSIYNHYYNDENFRRLERVTEVAASLNKSRTAIALGYLLSHAFPVYPIIGSRNLTQLSESCSAGDVVLDADTVRFLKTGDA